MDEKEQQRISDEEQRLELRKSESNVFKGWAQVVLVVLICIALAMMIWAMNSWRKSSNVVGATNANVNSFIDEGRNLLSDIRNKVNEIDTSKLNSIADKVGTRVDALGDTQEQLTGLISDVRGETRQMSTAIAARLQTVDGLIVSLRGGVDKAKFEISQNGDESAKALASFNTTIKDVDARVSQILDDGALMIETANPKLQELLAHADAVVVDADGTIKAYQPVGVNLAGITDDFHKMTTDSQKKLHEIFYPAPVKGFWPNVGRVLKYVYQPAFDGIRIYYTLHSLPVRVTQPIPVK